MMAASTVQEGPGEEEFASRQDRAARPWPSARGAFEVVEAAAPEDTKSLPARAERNKAAEQRGVHGGHHDTDRGDHAGAVTAIQANAGMIMTEPARVTERARRYRRDQEERRAKDTNRNTESSQGMTSETVREEGGAETESNGVQSAIKPGPGKCRL